MSFLRPLSETSIRSESTAADFLISRGSQSSSGSSKRSSRPPSLSYSRTNSDMSLMTQASNRMPNSNPSTSKMQPVIASQGDVQGPEAFRKESIRNSADALFTKIAGEALKDSFSEPPKRFLIDHPSQIQTLHAPASHTIAVMTNRENIQIEDPKSSTEPNKQCTCNCHVSLVQAIPRPAYTDVSVQTKPLHCRTPSPIDTAISNWSPNDYSAVSQEFEESSLDMNPVFMGRMLNYFNKPGYQLGDSLMSGYDNYRPLEYQYQEEFGDEALR